MKHLPQLFANNRAWAARRTAADPAFFERLCAIQAPRYLWIGCSDSRVPANEIVGMDPGELFVHRNIANLVRPDDANCLSVLQYAVDTLKISDVIVCGHYGCGGIQTALGPDAPAPLGEWLAPLRALGASRAAELGALPDDTARSRRLCELSVVEQVRGLSRLPTPQAAWRRRQPLVVHGWVYDLHDGLLKDLDVSVSEIL